MSDRKARAVGRLFAAFTKPLDDMALQSWLAGLADLDDDAVERGVLETIRTVKAWPSVAHVRESCGAGEDAAALDGWELALNHIRSGYKLEVPLQVEVCVKMLGSWDSIGMVPKTDLHFVQKRFMDFWADAVRKAEDQKKQVEGGSGVHSRMIEDVTRRLEADGGRKPGEGH